MSTEETADTRELEGTESEPARVAERVDGDEEHFSSARGAVGGPVGTGTPGGGTAVPTRVDPRTPRAVTLCSIAIECLMKDRNGAPIEGGLTREEWEQVLHQATGVIPYRVTVINAKRAYFLFFHETNIFRVGEVLNAITEYKGTPVECSCLMQDRAVLERRLEKERLGLTDSQVSLEVLAEERTRYQREMDAFRSDINTRLMALQDRGGLAQRGGEERPAPRPEAERELRFKPQIGTFSGTLPVPKGEVSFQQWKYQVQVALTAHSDKSVRGVMLSSITGPASTALSYVGMGASIDEILQSFQRRYLQQKTPDQWWSDFFSVKQGPKESVISLVTQLETVFTHLEEADPTVTRDILKERFYQSMNQRMRDSLRFAYEREGSTYESLIDKAKMVEAERADAKATVASATVGKGEKGNDLGSLGQKVTSVGETLLKKLDGMSAQMQSLQRGGVTMGVPRDKGTDERQSRDTRRKGEGDRSAPPERSTGVSRSGSREKGRDFQCYNCGGWNHVAKVCPSGKANWGENNRAGLAPEKMTQNGPGSKQ